MKKILTGIICLTFLFALVSCSEGADPNFRIRNDRADKANVQIQTSGGNTINLNDVINGTVTEYKGATKGNITVTAVIQNEAVSPTVTFFAENDESYTVVILAGTIPTLRVDED